MHDSHTPISSLSKTSPPAEDARWRALGHLALSDASGDKLFEVITGALSQAFPARWVGFGIRNLDDPQVIDVVSFRNYGSQLAPFSFHMDGSPCGALYDGAEISPYVFISDKIPEQYPSCSLLTDIGAESYLGEVILDRGNKPVAHVLLIDDKPLQMTNQEIEFFRLLSHRAGAEFRRSLAEQRVQEVMAEREHFLASICHDLSQTPLAARLLVSKLSTVVGDNPGSDIVAQLDTTLASMGDLLDELRTHFLETSDRSRASSDFGMISLSRLFHQLNSKFSPLAEEKGIDIRFVDTSLQVFSDAMSLRIILGNLIANAVRYTQSGKVLFGCRRRNGAICIEVWDTGIGIESADIPLIFSRYYRGRNVLAANSNHPGYGLGLSIVKSRLDVIDATFSVLSQVDHGTVFRIDLPICPTTCPYARPID